ncbi:MAG: hypothetical protein ACYSRZ_00650 [Planctomycetota bacterium]|jgi:hypothetical protein
MEDFLTYMKTFLTYAEANPVKLLAWGVGGLGFVLLIKVFLMGANGEWRWKK